jgi:hypothetical protein
MTEQQQQQPDIPAPPVNAAEASARLDVLAADKAWGKRLAAGDAVATKEFNSLTTMVADDGDKVAVAMSGQLPPGANGEIRELAGTASMLREVGIKDEIIKDVLAGTHTVTKAEYDATVRWKADHMSDPVWVKSYLGGSAEARRQAVLADIILSSNIKSEAA